MVGVEICLGYGFWDGFGVCFNYVVECWCVRVGDGDGSEGLV